MNLLLLHPSEVDSSGNAILTGRRAQHAQRVLRAAEKNQLRAGVRGGRTGHATVLSCSADRLELSLSLSADPPPRPGIDLLLAVPRPKALNRVVPALASLGVDRVVLLNAARVEKSYFDSSILAADSLSELCDLGLEQSKDTVAPTFVIRHRFRPFVEDELDAWAGSATRLVLHPDGAVPAAARPISERLVLAIGPDGGWVPFELDLLREAGFTALSLGQRTLRVEVAVSAAIGALRPFI